MRRLAIGLTAVVLLGAGCGGDGTSSDTAATTPGPGSPTTAGSPTTVGTTADPDPLAAEVGAVTISGDPIPPFTEGDDPAVGLVAPVAVGTDYAGNEVTIGAPGTAQAVLFVAHWCSHCQAEVPAVIAWLEESGGVPGVDVVIVSVGVDPNQANFPPSAWLEREGWTGPVLRDDAVNSAFAAYAGGAIPYFVLISADGVVTSRFLGETPIETLAGAIEAIG
jgi:thiol-disulfide isomerase/thioredoxin